MSSGFGPGFQQAGSKLYRAEYGAITTALVAFLLWKGAYGGGIDWFQVVFWILLPDLVAFIPIGISSHKREWPRWGADLYNTSHTILVWILAAVLAFALLRTPYWPLLGWLGHITADRALGYGLRSRAEQPDNVKQTA